MTAQTAARQPTSPQTPPLPDAKPQKLGLSAQRLQRMAFRDHLRKPEAADQQHPRRSALPREMVDEPERGFVAPVQILDDDQEWRPRRPMGEELHKRLRDAALLL